MTNPEMIDQVIYIFAALLVCLPLFMFVADFISDIYLTITINRKYSAKNSNETKNI